MGSKVLRFATGDVCVKQVRVLETCAKGDEAKVGGRGRSGAAGAAASRACELVGCKPESEIKVWDLEYGILMMRTLIWK